MFLEKIFEQRYNYLCRLMIVGKKEMNYDFENYQFKYFNFLIFEQQNLVRCLFKM